MKFQSFEERLKSHILVLDGAMGTMLQNANLTAVDFGGENYEGCNEYLNITVPNVIEDIHEAYLHSGADIIETNTFGATNIVLADYDLEHLAIELNEKAAQIARKAADKYSTLQWPRYVAGSMGPTTKSLSVTGGATFEDLVEAYEQQAYGLLLGGVDLLLIETSQDTRNVKAAYVGIEKTFKKLNKKVPLMISGTIEPMGTTLAGQNIEAFYLSIEHMNPAVVGINCATGPEFMQDHIRSLANLSSTAIICFPNAGLPDEEGHYHESPEMLARKLKQFAEKGWLNVVGGCCGTTPFHIKAIREVISNMRPRQLVDKHPHALSGIEPLIYDETMRPLFVGERTNVIGSKKFKTLIREHKYEEASEIARAQVKKGAHVIDICLADPDSDELVDMENFLPFVVNKVKVPLMIDSTDDKVIERALTFCQGKAVINSINLEDGLDRFEAITPLIHKYGAAVVVGTIDEIGMAVTAEKKLEVALRSYDLLVNKYQVNPKDIIFDPLVFPVGTGDEQYIGSAKETIEGIKKIKERLPECLTILGISNISFGLPPVGREILNSVFLYHCTQAGLDYAIVNTEKLERFASIKEEERILAEKLLFEQTDKVLAEFTAFYRGKKKEEKKASSNQTLEERLQSYIVEGTKEGLIPDLELALKKYEKPLDIINGPLMAGMDTVGKLFNNNELIVAEVLQSAEVMKASVQFLEQFMEKKDDSGKGKILLATVKGDVHDIGKNLVEIILSNNGFKVINLGIKITSNELIEAVKKETPDAIGLSGLLVKSAQQMVLTAQDLREQKISIPILVGGAALTRKFTETKIQEQYDGEVLYAKDAMNGLEIANGLFHNKGKEKTSNRTKKVIEPTSEQQAIATPDLVLKSLNISLKTPVFKPNDLVKHTYLDYKLTYLKPYINIQTLLGKHLGLKGKVERLIKEGNEKATELKSKVDDLFNEIVEKKYLKAKGVYQFFPAQSEGNDIIIYDQQNNNKEIERFTFPRQKKEPYRCLSDYIKTVDSKEMDYVGFLAVTAGEGVRDLSTKWKEDGDYLRSHLLQAIALELAEAFAEHIHHLMRNSWGIPDDSELSMQDRFSARYQGMRVSFGYPACPDLMDQKKLFQLINPEEIGIDLTEEAMMDPEASVSAMVFAHPEARYFNVE